MFIRMAESRCRYLGRVLAGARSFSRLIYIFLLLFFFLRSHCGIIPPRFIITYPPPSSPLPYLSTFPSYYIHRARPSIFILVVTGGSGSGSGRTSNEFASQDRLPHICMGGTAACWLVLGTTHGIVIMGFLTWSLDPSIHPSIVTFLAALLKMLPYLPTYLSINLPIQIQTIQANKHQAHDQRRAPAQGAAMMVSLK